MEAISQDFLRISFVPSCWIYIFISCFFCSECGTRIARKNSALYLDDMMAHGCRCTLANQPPLKPRRPAQWGGATIKSPSGVHSLQKGKVETPYSTGGQPICQLPNAPVVLSSNTILSPSEHTCFLIQTCSRKKMCQERSFKSWS